MDFEVIKRLLASLEREGVRYAIFGAVALNLQRIVFLSELSRNVELNISPRIAGLGDDAPVVWRGKFRVARRRRGTARFLQDDAACIQKRMPAHPASRQE